jgi:hypothetical membrane protein
MSRFGTLNPVIGVIMVLLSIYLTPEWSLGDSLFDLGLSGFGSVLFNSGLLMSGSLAMIYSAGLFEYTKDDIVGQVGSISFLIYSLSISILGISIIDLGFYREYVILLLFIMIPLSTLLLSYFLYKRGLKKFTIFGVFVIIFSLIPWILGGQIDAFKEFIALLPFNFWQIMVGLHMYRLSQ